jgi:methylenetetrahydrofolate dehydrogenase (NADP+) / methenyltetrahydrofolate cyclohydrolase
MTKIIDGKKIAQNIRHALAKQVLTQKSDYNIHAALCVIIVGDDAASHIYVNNKEKSAQDTGIKSVVHRLAENVTQKQLDDLIYTLNNDSDIHGILVQMPLPKHLNEYETIEKINPLKDVDGFHSVNTGLLHGASPQSGLLPCTPHGCMILLRSVMADISGKNALVIGRSHIVGRPVAELLLQENATVTIAHSKTKNLPDLCKNADIIVAAVGIAEMIKGDWIKESAVIIDVGINRIMDNQGKSKLVGDVDFAQALSKASFITPVPGGVGPMTIACLLKNTVIAAYLQNDLHDMAKTLNSHYN